MFCSSVGNEHSGVSELSIGVSKVGFVLSILGGVVLTSSETCSGSSLIVSIPRGARSLVDTVVSLPLERRMCAYSEFESSKVASSTSGSYFDDRTCFLRSTGPGVVSHVGVDTPLPVLLAKLNIL